LLPTINYRFIHHIDTKLVV